MTPEELFDRLDSCVFTGDTFIDLEARKDFREWMARWERGLKEFDETSPEGHIQDDEDDEEDEPDKYWSIDDEINYLTE